MNEETLKVYLSTTWEFVLSNSWIAIASIFSWGIVRVLKSDTKIPIDISPRLRPILAISFGLLASTLEKIVAGGDWKTLAKNAVIVGVGALCVHIFGVDVLRGGKDIPVPNFLSKNEPEQQKYEKY